MAEPKTREQVLEDALRDLIRNFRQTVASGRSRIVEEAGGDESACDSVEQMLAGNPYLRNAENALALRVPGAISLAGGWGELREGKDYERTPLQHPSTRPSSVEGGEASCAGQFCDCGAGCLKPAADGVALPDGGQQ